MIYIKTYNTPKINKKEILRYAGVSEADEQTLTLLDSCVSGAESVFSYKVCYRRYPIRVNGDELDLGFAKTTSHSLGLCLKE